TLRTCGPAGSMVMTTSASLTASATEPTGRQPASAARSRAAADRSKAATSCPALAWLAAMPPPMLPRPMKAMRVICTFPLWILAEGWRRRLRFASHRFNRALRSARLAEAVDELVGLAPDRLVEDVQAVVVGRVGDGGAFVLEDEAGGLDLATQLGALDA